MVFQRIRDYLTERLSNIKLEWSIFQSSGERPSVTLESHQDSDIHRIVNSFRFQFRNDEINQIYREQHDIIVSLLEQRSEFQGFPAEFRIPDRQDIFPPPDNRIPCTGIKILPWKYKPSRIVRATNETPESGFHVHPKLMHVIDNRYPQYRQWIHKYCRPLGTTDATVADFFKPQFPVDPLDPVRKELILQHIIRKLDATPYLPLHFVDSTYDKTPLNTGTGYFNRHSYELNAHATFSHPKLYEQRTTSKGYFINAFLETARTLVHRIKLYGVPFFRDFTKPLNLDHLRNFFLDHPIMLWTRNHISDRDGNLKQRPVYAVDDLFLRLESMAAFPFLVSCRKITCCIMYGFETFRGSNAAIDQLARSFRSFFSIDWSGFDQRLPWLIVDTFFTDFLERMIIISHGYQPTYEWPTYPDLTEQKMFTRFSNILWFIRTWYYNMVAVTADGFAYTRTTSGVWSGMLLTQILDSYGNLFLLIDGLIEFGCSSSEIDEIFLLVMGDDNSGFTHWPISKLEDFISFFESYALKRYGMVLSKTKSVITVFRNRIETLGYSCNFGMPTRPIGKLVAQLAFPEHGPIPKYTSYRAIGMAYAACGMDETFHDYCRDVYYAFLDDAVPLDPASIENITRYLPGYMRIEDSLAENISFEEFPSLQTVQRKLTIWQGPLSFSPKWNRAHFINDPDTVPSNAKTIAEYRTEHNIPRDPVPVLF
jgi:hypothetical protein